MPFPRRQNSSRTQDSKSNALLCYEVGKTWPEADADIAETIDFCEYYGREMLRLAGPQQVDADEGREKLSAFIFRSAWAW